LSSLAEVLSEKMPDQFLLPAFYDWRDGKIPTLAALEPAVEGRLKDWLESADGKQSLAPSVINWFENLRPEVEKLTNPICDKYHIQRSALGLPSLKTPGGKLPSGMFDPTVIVGIDDFGAVISVIVSIVVAVLAGGGGSSLIMAGPLGWVIGFFLGLIAMTVGWSYASEVLKTTNLPKITRKVVPKGMIAKRLKKKENVSQIKDKILEGFNQSPESLETMTKNISEAIREQLNKSADAAELLIK